MGAGLGLSPTLSPWVRVCVCVCVCVCTHKHSVLSDCLQPHGL